MIKKLSLIILTLCLFNSPIQADWKEKIANGLLTTTKIANLGITILLLNPAKFICYKKNIRQNASGEFVYINDLKDAPDEIVKWCKFILKKYEIPNIDLIKFKVIPDDPFHIRRP